MPTGDQLKHDTPYLGSAGTGIMISDGVSIVKYELVQRLAAKNICNLTAIGWYLFVQWIRTVGFLLIPLGSHGRFGLAVIPVTALIMLLLVARTPVEAGSGCALQRHTVQESGLAAAGCSHRAKGLRRRLLHPGEDPRLHRGRLYTQRKQRHPVSCAQEEGVFKSDHTTLGACYTVGINAFVHYGVTLGDGAVLAADAFLMKGAEVMPDVQCSGNPAGGRSRSPPVSYEEELWNVYDPLG